MRSRLRWVALVAATSLTPACRGPASGETSADALTPDPWVCQPLASPAAGSATTPRITRGADGVVYLTWVATDGADGASSLWFSRLQRGHREPPRWSEARRIAAGTDWFLNWADFPAFAALEDGTLLATWLAKAAEATYAYHVQFALSRDGGTSWSEPRVLHEDRSATEHGFVSLVPIDERLFGAVWLDGRATAHGGPMQLRFRKIGYDGSLGPELLLDDRVCDCCPTALAATQDGALVCAYRDRSEDEIRDIGIVRGDAEGFGEPQVLHADGWEMPGCPVNGPALAASGQRFAVAWYTGAGGGAGRVQLALALQDEPFGTPVSIDDGAPEGRVDVDFVAGSGPVVTWLEHGEDGASWRYRSVAADGDLGPSERIAAVSSDRRSGCLQIAGDLVSIVAAWIELGRDASRIATARIGPRAVVVHEPRSSPSE